MKKFDTRSMVLLALLAGILLVMAFTPLGYLKIPALELEVTLNMIPVAIGAIVLGPTGGAILGAVFGLTSFAQCFGGGFLGTLMLGYSPIGAFTVCFVPRVLTGWLAGLIYKLLSAKVKNVYGIYPVIGFLTAIFNTILFTSTFMAIFVRVPEVAEMKGGMNLIAFMLWFVGINAVFEMITGTVLTAAVASALKKAKLLKPAAV